MRISDWSSDVCSSDLPIGLAVDTCGNVWVADSENNRVAVFDKNLEFVDDVTQGFDLPTGVALGPDGDDTLYVVDSVNERIVKFRSAEPTSDLPSPMRTSSTVLCFTKKPTTQSN